jgi:hypothetical protein
LQVADGRNLLPSFGNLPQGFAEVHWLHVEGLAAGVSASQGEKLFNQGGCAFRFEQDVAQ